MQALMKEEVVVQALMKEEVEHWGVLVDLLEEEVDWMVEQDDLLEELDYLEVVLDYSFGIAFLIAL